MPCLEIALSTPPVPQPISASYWLVWTWSSATDSIGVRTCAPPEPPFHMSLLKPPSSANCVFVNGWPLMLTESAPHEVDSDATTPGSNCM